MAAILSLAEPVRTGGGSTILVVEERRGDRGRAGTFNWWWTCKEAHAVIVVAAEAEPTCFDANGSTVPLARLLETVPGLTALLESTRRTALK